MCGIAGWVGQHKNNDAFAQVQKATASLSHRGPQQECFWQNEHGNIVLGHRRLCIIDLSYAAAQPMQLNRRFTLVYNGEIYNYVEVRNELTKLGHSFRSHSDTEVVLAAYSKWGKDCLERFDGMFAFAIWDEQEQILFAARDRFGEKPFFFHVANETLLFASELKALWQMGVEKEVNKSLLYNFLTIGYTTNPSDGSETFYHNIHKLPAAHYFIFDVKKGNLQLQPYWQVYVEENNSITDAEALEKFAALFKQSIQKRLRSDVAIGTSLSGGLDSSSIVALCQEQSAEHYSHKCFTASFAGFDRDETMFAKQVANRFHLHHFTTTIQEEEVANLMQQVIAAQDEPFSSASVLAQFKVFQLAKEQGVTVLLDGQGADEILGGYHKYYKWYWQELYRKKQLATSGEQHKAEQLGIAESFGLQNKFAALFPEFAASLRQSQQAKKAHQHPDLQDDFAFQNKRNLYYALPTQPDLNGALHFNTFTSGLEELLRLADRNSMAHSVEVRLPFLQHQLVEFLFTLPAHFKIKNGWTKWLLRKTVENHLPDAIVWRKDKVGFEPPQKAWMKNKAVQEQILEGKRKLVQQGILQAKTLEQPLQPKAVHDDQSFDWRYWSAAALY